ncbi:non-homologous end-joining factor 1 isoform X1 [Colletes latitarsis]|uniref:non-homologous end-joining factor 1 isoform X1 n=1 Tax=Colletes latitarsis TaxID=2605962 RepID=UPI004036C7F6
MAENTIFDRYKQGIIWNDVKIGNDLYMISITRRNDTTKVFLTNLIEIWMETLTNEIILTRCRELNPLLNVDAFNYEEVVANILSNILEYIVEASVEQIKLRAQIEEGSMKFALYLSKGTPYDFWEIITKPLCVSSMEIIRQHKILLDLVKRKDEEIAEYKAEGAELIRKNIETETFKEEDLKTNIFISNIGKCTSAFQAMMKFYNTLNLNDTSKDSTEFASSTSKNDKMEQCKDNRVDGSKEVANGDIHIQKKLETVKSKCKTQKKCTINEKVTSPKIRTRMIHKPIKKLKKGLNDFIL